LEPPLDELLRRHYGIEPVRLEPGSRGFVSETWVVHTAAERFFAKLIPIVSYTENIIRALPVQQELYDSGIRQMSRPIPTLTGALSVTLETNLLVVNDFIEAQWTSDFPFDTYVDLIARLHATTVESPVDVETFADWVLPDLERVLATAIHDSFEDPSQLAVQEVVRRMHPAVMRDVADYRRLLEDVAGRHDVPMVVTHHDAPGNILKDVTGSIYLVDWDEILMAPRERDTWFHLTTAEDAAAFLTVYRQRFPDYEPDEQFYRFYLVSRYLEEIEGLAERILSPETSVEARAEVLDSFRESVPPLEAAVRRAGRQPPPWKEGG
jgi:spectinomycin phosphotransferase